MNETAGRRRWFQLHLSTVIVLTLVAAGLLAANLRVGRMYSIYLSETGYTYRGWPAILPIDEIEFDPADRQKPIGERVIKSAHPFEADYGNESIWPWNRLLADVVAAVSILFIVGALCERIVRRRARPMISPESADAAWAKKKRNVVSGASICSPRL